MTPRAGRRGGDADTRGTILAAARSLFAADGYDATSLRAIARAADVDPALVHHYFDGKSDVFASAFSLPLSPDEVLPQLTAAPPDQLGERIVRLFLEVWNGPGAEHLAGILRSSLTHDGAAAMLPEYMIGTLLEGVVGTLGVDEPRRRAALCATQLVGLAVLRQVIGFAPLRELDDEDLVAWVGPVLQGYLTGPTPA